MGRIPKSVTVNTGEQGKIVQTIDDFFKETVEYVKANYEVKPGPECFSIKSEEISYDSATPVITNDRVTYLLYRTKIIAVVMETRTEFNYIHYDFFRNLEGLEKLIARKHK
ncbi:MAG: hypothetical protein ABIH65_02185 [Nanoarchaeota archaeon]